jgi:hypothetical protein
MRKKLVGKVYIATCVFLIILFALDFCYRFFDTPPIVMWFTSWQLNMAFLLTVLFEMEMMKAFSVLGSLLTPKKVLYLQYTYVFLWVVLSSGLYGYLPTLGEMPSPFFDYVYLINQSGTIMAGTFGLELCLVMNSFIASTQPSCL